jgi:hypothetical protein
MSVPPPDAGFEDERLGVLPCAGPVPYLTDSEEEARTLLAAAQPDEDVVWVHATSIDVARIVAHRGVVPSCWRGGDCCVVFGSADANDIKPSRGEALVEIESPAIPGQLRAWWVPHWSIRGAWIGDEFISAEQLREPPVQLIDDVRPCGCPLSALVREQQELWRGTWQVSPDEP